MKITKALFEISAASALQFPRADLPEYVFVGRSNVGKSSLLNMITGVKNLAKVSGTPGKTRLINFFHINGIIRFVDLPGYGYAKVSKHERETWRKLIETYFTQERSIKLIFVLIDSRHLLQELDAHMIEWFIDANLPVQIVLTKIDKLKQRERSQQIKELGSAFRQIGYEGSLIPFSTVTGEGKNNVSDTITSDRL